MGFNWLSCAWLWAWYGMAVGRRNDFSIMANICILVTSKEITEAQKKAANDAMYDHLDVFGWTKPARHFLEDTQKKIPNTLSNLENKGHER